MAIEGYSVWTIWSARDDGDIVTSTKPPRTVLEGSRRGCVNLRRKIMCKEEDLHRVCWTPSSASCESGFLVCDERWGPVDSSYARLKRRCVTVGTPSSVERLILVKIHATYNDVFNHNRAFSF